MKKEIRCESLSEGEKTRRQRGKDMEESRDQ
jgi:hypothetical protein